MAALAAAASAAVTAPPRGWNSYDSFTANVNESSFLANCQAMADLLLPHGFDTCVIDYLWYQTASNVWMLDDYCRPIPDVEKWPSSAGGKGFKPVADRVHAMGLRFGIHIMRGTSTHAREKNCVVKGTAGVRIADILDGSDEGRCPWKAESLGLDMSRPGAQAFYDSLYEQYALEWDVDFIKNDCVFRSRRVDEIRAQAHSIERVAPTRPIVYSLSPGISENFADEARLADRVLDAVNMYRITDDDWDVWGELAVHFDAAAAFASRIGRPGLLGGLSFPDLDMLPIGFVARPGDSHRAPDHWTALTRDEQTTQVTLWAMARSPLFFGGDVTKLRLKGNANATFTLSLLTNDAVLGLNHASSANREVRRDGGLRVWAAALATNATFVAAFFNIGDAPRKAASVRTTTVLGDAAASWTWCDTSDMWSGQPLGRVDVTEDSELTVAELPAHGSRLLELRCSAGAALLWS